MRLLGFVVLHLARQSKLGQLLPVTSAVVGHGLSIAAGSPRPPGVVQDRSARTCEFSLQPLLALS